MRGTAYKLRGISVGQGLYRAIGRLLAAAASVLVGGWLLMRWRVPEQRLLQRFLRVLQRLLEIEEIPGQAGLHTLAERAGMIVVGSSPPSSAVRSIATGLWALPKGAVAQPASGLGG
ncbi:MAG: hypothetical protein R2864_14810 [Syntrophotaleaceae bacterium]